MDELHEALCKLCNRDSCYDDSACADAKNVQSTIRNILKAVPNPVEQREYHSGYAGDIAIAKAAEKDRYDLVERFRESVLGEFE